jgi:hypothetical protein
MRPDAIYSQNVIDYPPDRFIKAELATVADVLPHVALIAPPDALAGRTGANFVIVASAAPLPLVALRSRLAQVDEPVTLLAGSALDDFIDDAEILTDDHAPVDQLLAG